MADPETEDLREIAASLAGSTRELNDAAAKIADALRSQSNTSNITIEAGGIANAIAVVVSICSCIMFCLFAVWIMWMESEREAKQSAWISVWQQHVQQHKGE